MTVFSWNRLTDFCWLNWLSCQDMREGKEEEALQRMGIEDVGQRCDGWWALWLYHDLGNEVRIPNPCLDGGHIRQRLWYRKDEVNLTRKIPSSNYHAQDLLQTREVNSTKIIPSSNRGRGAGLNMKKTVIILWKNNSTNSTLYLFQQCRPEFSCRFPVDTRSGSPSCLPHHSDTRRGWWSAQGRWGLRNSRTRLN